MLNRKGIAGVDDLVFVAVGAGILVFGVIGHANGKLGKNGEWANNKVPAYHVKADDFSNRPVGDPQYRP